MFERPMEQLLSMMEAATWAVCAAILLSADVNSEASVTEVVNTTRLLCEEVNRQRADALKKAGPRIA